VKQTPSTAAIILAAGSSSRMSGERHKLLLPLDDRPVLAHVIDAALISQARPILIVLGHQANQVRTQISTYIAHPAITLIENPDYLQGMSTSMCLGLRALISDDYRKNKAGNVAPPPHLQSAINQVSTTEVDSALIMLGDQPLITARIIDTLIETWRETGKRIVAPLYAGKRGNPTLFAASLFPELLEVTGDEGGRRVVERHRQELQLVELGDAMASYDVDTWEAYQEVVEAWQKKRSRESES